MDLFNDLPLPKGNLFGLSFFFFNFRSTLILVKDEPHQSNAAIQTTSTVEPNANNKRPISETDEKQPKKMLVDGEFGAFENRIKLFNY
jgi:hypothetical protein